MIRVLIYSGDAKWLQECLKRRGVKKEINFANGKIVEAYVGFDGGLFEALVGKTENEKGELNDGE